MKRLLAPIILLAADAASADYALHGIADVRLISTDSVDSYLDGGYGKFSNSEGVALSVGQLGLSFTGEFNDQFGVHVVGNGYAGTAHDGAGVTEAYLKYQGLPSSDGLRLQARAGLLYPKVSLENELTAWASPYTLNYSTLNTWIGEEVRHRGVEVSVTRLGKFHNSLHDVEMSLAAVTHNDPTGAMLAWHGWVSSSRQSLEGEELPLPKLTTGFVPEYSEPYRELDHRVGYHFTTQWDWHDHGKLLAGYYDNNADPHVEQGLQWAWRTRFAHAGIKWQLADDLDVIVQYLVGDTLMQSTTSNFDLVSNDFHSGFVLLSRKLGQHRISARVEEFAVIDRDSIDGDNNNEYGKAATLNYTYRFDRSWFISAEHGWVRSVRPSRVVQNQPLSLGEQQSQLAVRYFF